MKRTGWRDVWTALVAALLLTGGLAGRVQAAPPGGLEIGGTGSCVIRQGGHGGYRIDSEFAWFYPEAGSLGPTVTVSGTYTLQILNPTSGAYETLYSYPYGFALTPNGREARPYRISPRDEHWVFDQVRMEVTWQIEGGPSGTEVSTFGCEVQPPPEGLDPVLPPGPSAAGPAAPTETFVFTADPSPYAALTVDSSLLCQKGGSGRQFLNWGLIATNNGVGGGDGVTVSGSARFFTRLADGQYSLVEERPFALYMKPNETTALDGHLDSRDQAAARLEIDWQANVGTKVDSAASVQHILRTTACP